MEIVRDGWIFIELCLLRVSIFFHDLPENTSTRWIWSVITLTKTRDTPTGKCEDRLTRSNHRQLWLRATVPRINAVITRLAIFLGLTSRDRGRFPVKGHCSRIAKLQVLGEPEKTARSLRPLPDIAGQNPLIRTFRARWFKSGRSKGRCRDSGTPFVELCEHG